MSGTAENFIIKILSLMGIGQVSLLSALYNITTTNNTSYWTRGGALSAIIPVGTYSLTDLCLALMTAMDGANEVGTYQISHFPTITMKISIICTVMMVLTCTSTTNSIWYEIGFNTTANTSLVTFHTADNILQLNFPPFVIINISEISSI
jgi:hypothetical protein